MSSIRKTKDGLMASLQTWWEQGWLPGLLLAMATLVAYQPAWQAGFIWDDDVYVTRNPLLTAPDGLKRIWFSLDAPSQYCPLVYTSFRLERPFWGLNPTGYHIVNILLHAANALLVWRLLRRLAVPGAWLAAALFALHPVHVESVAWISERKNVLSLCFSLLALLAWVDFVEQRAKKPWRFYAQALLFYALALGSKTTACMLPAALILILWLKDQPLSRRRWAQIVPFVALGLGMGLLTMWWERYHQGTGGKLFALGGLERLLIASRAVWFYAGKLLWPVDLSFSYPRWTIRPADPLAYFWLAAGVALVAGILRARRYLGRGLETAAIFYVATLSPLLGFIMLYTFRYTFVADHYQYFASIGLLALAAAAITRGLGLFNKAIPLVRVILCGLLLVSLGSLTWRQCGMYADAETLWRTTAARNPDSYMAHNNLGTALMRQGRTEEAIAEFRRVLQLDPDYEVSHYDLGHALLRQGQRDEAIAQFRKAVELDPTYAAAHNNLANLLLSQGKIREALAHLETAHKLRPKSADLANNLAWILATSSEAGLRDGPRAVGVAREAERLSGGKEPVFIGTLAAAYAEAGRFAEAVAAAQRAIELASLQRNIALVQALSRQIALYQAGTPSRGSAAADAIKTTTPP